MKYYQQLTQIYLFLEPSLTLVGNIPASMNEFI